MQCWDCAGTICKDASKFASTLACVECFWPIPVRVLHGREDARRILLLLFYLSEELLSRQLLHQLFFFLDWCKDKQRENIL